MDYLCLRVQRARLVGPAYYSSATATVVSPLLCLESSVLWSTLLANPSTTMAYSKALLDLEAFAILQPFNHDAILAFHDLVEEVEKHKVLYVEFRASKSFYFKNGML